MCATESDIFYGDAPSHVVVDDHMNESEHVISKINREQTDFVQEESIACATSNTLFPSSPAHSPNQRDVLSHHTDSIDSLDTHDDNLLFKPLPQISLQPFYLNAILITTLLITLVVRLRVL